MLVIFKLMKQAFIAVLSFSGSLVRVTKFSYRKKFISVNKEPSLTRSTLFDLNLNEHYYYPCMVSLGKRSRS